MSTKSALEYVNPEVLNAISFLGRLGVKKEKAILNDKNQNTKIYISLPKSNDVENIDLSSYPYQDNIDITNYDLNDPEDVAELAAAIIKELLAFSLMEFSDVPMELRSNEVLRISTLSLIRVFSKVRDEDWNLKKSIENASHVIEEAMIYDAAMNITKLKIREQD